MEESYFGEKKYFPELRKKQREKNLLLLLLHVGSSIFGPLTFVRMMSETRLIMYGLRCKYVRMNAREGDKIERVLKILSAEKK